MNLSSFYPTPQEKTIDSSSEGYNNVKCWENARLFVLPMRVLGGFKLAIKVLGEDETMRSERGYSRVF